MRYSYGTNRRGFMYLITGLLLLAIGASPAVIIGIPLPGSGGHDADITLRWLTGFSQAMSAGMPWPRWLTGDVFGFGSPASLFYPPMAYWVASVVALVSGQNLDIVVRISIVVFAVAGFAFSWRLVRKLGAGSQAPVLAGLYVASPWLAFVDQIVRTAFAEYATIAVLPLIGMVLTGVSERRMREIVLTALAFAVLILTHLPVAVLAAASGLIYIWVDRGWFRISDFLAAQILAAGLAAPLLLPAMTMQGSISPQFWQLAGERASDQLLFFGHSYGMAMTASKYLCFAVFFITFLILKPWRRRCLDAPTAVLGACLIGTTMLTWPVWRYVPLLETVQIPARLFGLVALFWMMALARRGGLPETWGARLGHSIPAASTAALVAAVLAGEAAIPGFALHTVPSGQRTAAALDQPLVRATEYLPETADFRDWTRIVDGSRYLVQPDWARNLPYLAAGEGTVRQNRSARELTLDIHCVTACRVLARQFWFPGWRVDGHAARIDPRTGMIVFELPAGHRTVTAMRGMIIQEQAGWAISLASITLCVTLFGFAWRPSAVPQVL